MSKAELEADPTSTKFYYLVNVVAGVLIALVGLMTKALELQNFEVAEHYIVFIIVVFIIYLILRAPRIYAMLMQIYIQYYPEVLKIKNNQN